MLYSENFDTNYLKIHYSEVLHRNESLQNSWYKNCFIYKIYICLLLLLAVNNQLSTFLSEYSVFVYVLFINSKLNYISQWTDECPTMAVNIK